MVTGLTKRYILAGILNGEGAFLGFQIKTHSAINCDHGLHTVPRLKTYIYRYKHTQIKFIRLRHNFNLWESHRSVLFQNNLFLIWSKRESVAIYVTYKLTHIITAKKYTKAFTGIVFKIFKIFRHTYLLKYKHTNVYTYAYTIIYYNIT